MHNLTKRKSDRQVFPVKNKLCGAWSKFENECIRKKGHKGLHSDEEKHRGI